MQSVARVMTINYRSRERVTYGKVSSEHCFVDGYISYVFVDHATDELWASYGELGRELTIPIRRGGPGFDRGPQGSCRPWAERPSRPAWIKSGIEVRYLWPRLGLINCNVTSSSVHTQQVKARFHSPEDPAGIELPFSCYEVSMGLRYYAFKGAYFAWEHDFRHPWPEGHDRRAFWLYPDGRVETMTFKYSSAITHEAIPTKRGLIAFARALTREDDYWVYLLTADSAKKIVRGDAGGVTSPDGCKVAMSHDPDFSARISGRTPASTATLKVLELCR